jgi:gamma-glutamylputrescine oxidase
MKSPTSPSRHVSAAASSANTFYHDSACRPFPITKALDGEVSAEVVIIGAGFTGVSAALDLAQAGLKVVVLEANLIGAGASGRNGGLACSGWRHDQGWFEKRIGIDDAQKIWSLAEDAKADLLDRMKRYKIDADWQNGQIFAAHTPAMMRALNRDADHMADTYNYHHPVRLDASGVAQALGANGYHGGWRDPSAGHLHPLKLLYGLADVAKAAGAIFYENTRAREVGQKRAGKRFVRTSSGNIIADHVLLCGDGYLDGIQTDVEARVLPIGSFVLATEPLNEHPEILPQNDSAMDTRFVVNYWRKSADNRLVFGGGEKYTPGWPADVKNFVRANMIKVYPQLGNVDITHAWGGALGITPTRLPFLRQVGPGILSASGYSGQGVVLAPYFGRILAQVVQGNLGQYDLVSRLPVPHFPGGRALRWPLLTAAMSWYALRDKLP